MGVNRKILNTIDKPYWEQFSNVFVVAASFFLFGVLCA